MHSQRDMRKSLLCVVMASCAWSDPAENVLTQAEGESCNVPPIQCYPLEDGPRYCGLACGNILAYCKDYPDSAYAYCYKHPGHSKCSPFGEPIYPTECTLGAPATPPDMDRSRGAVADLKQRIKIIKFARALANPRARLHPASLMVVSLVHRPLAAQELRELGRRAEAVAGMWLFLPAYFLEDIPPPENSEGA